MDFTNQLKDGCLCLFSIKNPAYPEYAVMTDSPIIALDVYKETPYMICVGKIFGYLVLSSLKSTYEFCNFKRIINDEWCYSLTTDFLGFDPGHDKEI